jgi:hypothetical protein
VEPSSPTPFSRRRKGAKPYYFLVPLSCGRGARGDGFTNFHVTPVITVYFLINQFNQEIKRSLVIVFS